MRARALGRVAASRLAQPSRLVTRRVVRLNSTGSNGGNNKPPPPPPPGTTSNASASYSQYTEAARARAGQVLSSIPTTAEAMQYIHSREELRRMMNETLQSRSRSTLYAIAAACVGLSAAFALRPRRS